MDKKSITYTLDEFNSLVSQGEIFEISVTSGQIRIVCTTAINIRGSNCGAHLRDIWFFRKKAERWMRVGCGVCGFKGERKIGATGYINGSGH